ncbi:MAG: D-alanyl-D-alanine carboxypeptidase family protein [Blastocatellia bacterium]
MSSSPNTFRVRSDRLWRWVGAIIVLAGSAAGGFTAQRPLATSADNPSPGIGSFASPTTLSIPAAIESNKTGSTELKWVFGGKAQRGWAIYLPLILEAVGARKDMESAEFAEAVAHWQTVRGLRATGVVDLETWSEMIRELQSRRIKQRNSPPSEGLVVVPASEFYDDERPAELRQVERNAYAAYKRLVAGAAKDRSLGLRVTASGEFDPAEKYLKIISGFRSREHQDRLRQAAPRAGRAGLAVNSPHFTGRALDLYVGGEPVSSADDNRLAQTRTPVYRWLVKNAGKFGFRPYFYEPWHWEYVPGPQ